MLLTGIAISFFVTFSTLPVIIRLFRSINLLDAPDRRKVHKLSQPSLGGISIYSGVLIALLFVVPLETIGAYKFFFAGVVISLLLGMRDDISSLYANQKLVFQVLAAFVTVYYADIALTGMYGLFGIQEFPGWLSVSFSVFVILSISNAFNLIDGIDGLAASVAVFVSLVFGIWFLLIGDDFFATVAFVIASALVAFLIFNWHPAKIFMGDTGSLVTGFILGVMAIRFIDQTAMLPEGSDFAVNAPITLAFSLLIVPVYDTLRVMSIRVYNGMSPFHPDKKHIHHTLIRQGFSHSQATLILLAFTFIVFCVSAQISFLGEHLSLIVLFVMAVSFGAFWDWRLGRYLEKEKAKASANRSLYISKSA
jgi:UDP-GlcNAc:undecaprenyl-phosphate GlcNAc-1-phosphate transferase